MFKLILWLYFKLSDESRDKFYKVIEKDLLRILYKKLGVNNVKSQTEINAEKYREDKIRLDAMPDFIFDKTVFKPEPIIQVDKSFDEWKESIFNKPLNII